MKIRSAIKIYSVEFIDNFNLKLGEVYEKGDLVLIDKNVPYLPVKGIDYIELIINENSKEYAYVGKLIEQLPTTFNKTNKIIAVGGGITQDIATYISAILFRGVKWIYFPTTLLAQGDSCIGGKASINLNGIKNKLGLFNPPDEIYININFTNSLLPQDLTSGLGEMLHFYLVSGEKDYKFFQYNINNLEALVNRCLSIKKYFIEADEFDKGERLLLNYGHTFGHAIEGATQYKHPHGIAVSKGMDIANYISYRLGYLNKNSYLNIKETLKHFYKDLKIPSTPDMIRYLKQDKKNSNNQLTCILTKGPGKMFLTELNYSYIELFLNEYE